MPEESPAPTCTFLTSGEGRGARDGAQPSMASDFMNHTYFDRNSETRGWGSFQAGAHTGVPGGWHPEGTWKLRPAPSHDLRFSAIWLVLSRSLCNKWNRNYKHSIS